MTQRHDLERVYRSFYDVEAVERATRPIDGRRRRCSEAAMQSMANAGVRIVADVGSGPGRDSHMLRQAGFEVAPVDLSFTAAQLARGVVGSIFDLPLRRGSVDAVWTMSTLVHVPDELVAQACAELGRVVAAGGLIVIGTWGGVAAEYVGERQVRYFLRDDATFRAALQQLGEIIEWNAREVEVGEGRQWSYRFVVVRAGPASL